MTDIIIPSYKAQTFIDKLLSSINAQLDTSNFKVTIVNDGYGNYEENIKRFPSLNIQELSYCENKGCGYARQYGLEHTDGEYVIFCDSDDVLYNATSIQRLIEPFEEDEKIVCVYSPIINYTRKCFVINDCANLYIWLHGKSYRRSFLTKHNISFYPNSAGEDCGFNKQVMMNASEKSIVQLKEPCYVWTDFNEENRINTMKFGIFSSKKGLIENMLHVMKNAMYNKIDPYTVYEELLGFFIDLYVQYNMFLCNLDDFKITENECDEFLIWCKPIYFVIKNKELDMDICNNIIFEKTKILYEMMGLKFKGIKCTFEEFIEKLNDLMEV